MININQTILTEDIKKFIFDGFNQHSIKQVGIDGGFGHDHIVFTAQDAENMIGAISFLPFWGALWIKYLFIDEKYRGQGIAKQLMERAIEFGIEQRSNYAFVETMSFQAPNFYKKLGFELEYTRLGFDGNVQIHYLRKKIID